MTKHLENIARTCQIAFYLLVSTITLIIVETDGHVRLWMPISRSSAYRDHRFKSLSLEPNFDDAALYCGQVPQTESVKECGICGDPIKDAPPRANENGGTYGRGVIVQQYTSGSIIDVKLEFTTAHLGYVRYELCPNLPETESCFSILKLAAAANETKAPLSVLGKHNIFFEKRVQLPAGVKCSHCVFRITYRTGNSWGECGNGTGALGCGLQETFRQCSDIAII